MFMGRIDIDNTIKLTKVKYIVFKRNMLRGLVIALFLLLVNSILSLSLVFTESRNVSAISLQNFSFAFFLAGVMLSLFMSISYKTINKQYSIFPQNNTSRFLSSQLINYSFILFLSIASLIAYLFQYLVFKTIATNYNNVFLAYKFNFEFLIVGFLVFIMYLSLISAVMTFVGTLFRKHAVYTFVVLGVLFSLIMYNDILKGLVANVLEFIIYENSLSIFFIKGAITWFILMFLSLVINKYTEFYKEEKTFSKAVVIGITLILIFTIFIVPQMIITDYSSNVRVTEHHESIYKHNSVEIEVDISQIEEGSLIEVYTNSEDSTYYAYVDEMTEGEKGKIIISAVLPLNQKDGINLIEFTDPKVFAELKENNLYINYQYNENIKVVFLSPWLVMNQFNRYIGEGIFKENPGSYSSRGSGHMRIIHPDNVRCIVIN
ncbi:hypothetical protein [Serpentinicella alkaliphila]|uniref:ABC-type transport system involved in multi-copper enzyme maturation permease subunit n=1 Tax=Serpentinicella alkaliphila TaxID=1734049 RepID=A0A4R2T5C1_9FIRM|nr:hypothetical protein [Serpentinicella alkaliphila]QUH26376.1 hypothetical protein HZR23_11990 [Serpentinicella alkaliphila]TCP97600.1 hypothetical protein EDD79_10456 [Serpentinicella alkaliphila]